MRYLEAIASAGDETKSSLLLESSSRRVVSTIHHLTRRADSGDEPPVRWRKGSTFMLSLTANRLESPCSVRGARRSPELARVPSTSRAARARTLQGWRDLALLCTVLSRKSSPTTDAGSATRRRVVADQRLGVCVRYGGALANAARGQKAVSPLGDLLQHISRAIPLSQALNFDPRSTDILPTRRAVSLGLDNASWNLRAWRDSAEHVRSANTLGVI